MLHFRQRGSSPPVACCYFLVGAGFGFESTRQFSGRLAQSRCPSTLLNSSQEPNLRSQVASPCRVRRGESMSEVPVILVVEDDYPLQGVVEDILIEGGFGVDILSSAEEALTLFGSGIKSHKALVTD